MVISIFIIYMYHHRHYCNCYCHSRHFYPNRTVFTFLITIYVFTEGFSSELFSVKGVCSFETPWTFHAYQSYKKFHNKHKMPQLLSIWIFERVGLSIITEQTDNKFLIIGTRLFRSQLNSPDGCKLLIFLPSYWLDSRWGRQHSKRMTFWFRNASLCKVNGTFFLFSVFVIAKGILIFSEFRLCSAESIVMSNCCCKYKLLEISRLLIHADIKWRSW